MKSKTISKDWGKLVTKDSYRIKYKKRKDDSNWMFHVLGWKNNG